MNFQYMAVIFVIIMVPISIVLAFYTQTQMDIVNTQTTYTTKLYDATYDAVMAFQLNTTNSYYSSVSDSKIRDINASINTFYNSLTASLSYSKEDLQAYTPAIVFTLYDGYYIYGKMYNVYKETEIDSTTEQLTGMEIDTTLDDANQYEYGIKPFVYYSCHYVKGTDGKNDIVVNFTLDNFISIYGTVNGDYVTMSGYLIDINNYSYNSTTNTVTYKGVEITGTETLKEYLMFTGSSSNGISDGIYTYIVSGSQKIYDYSYTDADGHEAHTYFTYDSGTARKLTSVTSLDMDSTSAVDYYKAAYEFSDWVDNNLDWVKQEYIQLSDTTYSLEYDSGDAYIFKLSGTDGQDPEDPTSTFNEHRIAIIKNSIITNLAAAINSFNNNASSYEYALPELTEEDWEKVVNNVCVISFMQGLPIGGKYFNNYVVVSNDKNNEFVDTDSIYILTEEGTNYVYHLPNCELLVESTDYQDCIVGGYRVTSFERQTMDSSYYYKVATEDSDGNKIYYTACYTCIVNSSAKYDLTTDIFLNSSNSVTDSSGTSYNIKKLRTKYLTILAREKYNLYKTNN